MRKITKEEVSHLDLIKRRGKYPENPVVTEIAKLNINEYLLIEKKDWTPKTLIHSALRDAAPLRRKRRKFSVKSLADKTGWIVKRIA